MKAKNHKPGEGYPVDTECPQYRDGYCLWLSEECGRAEYATGVRCSRDCQREQPKSLALRVLTAEHNTYFVARTLSKTQMEEVVVRVPPAWPEIERALMACGVLDSEHVGGVYMTGSAIKAGNDNPKDFDIAIVVEDLAGWLSEGLRDKLPFEIDGRKLDVWVHIRLSPIYPMLDCTAKVLHLPAFGADTRYIGDDGIRVVPADYEAWTPEQRAVLHSRVEEAKAVMPAPVAQSTPKAVVVQASKPCGTCSRAKRTEARK